MAPSTKLRAPALSAYCAALTAAPTAATTGCYWLSALNGTIYGVSLGGGANTSGTIYKLAGAAAFPHFITVQNYSGKSGSTIDILGTAFTGATTVSFGTVRATSFKVVKARSLRRSFPRRRSPALSR